MTQTNLKTRDISTVIDDRAFLECPRCMRTGFGCPTSMPTKSCPSGSPATYGSRREFEPAVGSGLAAGRTTADRIHARPKDPAPRALRRTSRSRRPVRPLPTKINDMVVDGFGRAWVGSFGFEFRSTSAVEPADLIRIDPDGTVSIAATGLRFPNGAVVTPEGVLVVAEYGQPAHSIRHRRQRRSDQSPHVGGIRRRRPYVLGGRRNGRVVRRAGRHLSRCRGAIWVADALNRRLVRVRESAGIVDEIPFETGVFACMLGGTDGRTLYACASPSSSGTSAHIPATPACSLYAWRSRTQENRDR